MSGERVKGGGRNGEEPPRTWAMRDNDGVWEWEKRRVSRIRGAIGLIGVALIIAGISLWRMF